MLLSVVGVLIQRKLRAGCYWEARMKSLGAFFDALWERDSMDGVRCNFPGVFLWSNFDFICH